MPPTEPRTPTCHCGRPIVLLPPMLEAGTAAYLASTWRAGQTIEQRQAYATKYLLTMIVAGMELSPPEQINLLGSLMISVIGPLSARAAVDPDTAAHLPDAVRRLAVTLRTLAEEPDLSFWRQIITATIDRQIAERAAADAD